MCNLEANQGEILCDCCNTCFHLACVNLPQLPVGFWYCEDCTLAIAEGHLRDLTVDTPLMHWMFHKEHLEGLLEEDKGRVERASEFL